MARNDVNNMNGSELDRLKMPFLAYKIDHNAYFNKNQFKYEGPKSGQRKLADLDGIARNDMNNMKGSE
ncbi:hypothetical protein QUF72_13990 [Desulfobacterales bacterium HSG2]|nr:hypothetical protein [Desulfobacterales bacterium HSG2]